MTLRPILQLMVLVIRFFYPTCNVVIATNLMWLLPLMMNMLLVMELES